MFCPIWRLLIVVDHGRCLDPKKGEEVERLFLHYAISPLQPPLTHSFIHSPKMSGSWWAIVTHPVGANFISYSRIERGLPFHGKSLGQWYPWVTGEIGFLVWTQLILFASIIQMDEQSQQGASWRARYNYKRLLSSISWFIQILIFISSESEFEQDQYHQLGHLSRASRLKFSFGVEIFFFEKPQRHCPSWWMCIQSNEQK